MAESEQKFFDMVLVVELQEAQDGKTAPFISYRYPQLFESDPFSASVTQFCFPDINQFPTEHMPSETFSFVLTDSGGDRRFGYCLRKLPPGTGPRFPVAFSIMTYFPCFQLYSKVLEQVAYHYENSSMSMLTFFLESVSQNKFPSPGESFEVSMESGNLKSSHRFTRPDDSDSQLEHVDLDTFLIVMDPMNILTIFASLLVERRTIFCSQKLSTLSSCVQTAVALLYPFTWQHIYIPVLPKSLLSFCCAPMPFVVGILASELREVLTLPMDEVLIIDLDSNSFIRTPEATSDIELLPPNYINQLQKSLKTTSKILKRHKKKRKDLEKAPKNEERDLEEKRMNYEKKKQTIELTDTFLQFFVYILGSYRHFVHNGEFDKEQFAASHAPETQEFMNLFVGSQMFERFVEERIHTQYKGGFEKKIEQFEKLSRELTKHFGDDIADPFNFADVSSKRGRPQSKRKPGDKGGGLLNTLRKNMAMGTKSAEVSLISTPTVVSTTSDRVSHDISRPPPPPKPAVPEFIVPKKPLPPAPGMKGSNIAPRLPARNAPQQHNMPVPKAKSSSLLEHSNNEFDDDDDEPSGHAVRPQSMQVRSRNPGPPPAVPDRSTERRGSAIRGRGIRGRRDDQVDPPTGRPRGSSNSQSPGRGRGQPPTRARPPGPIPGIPQAVRPPPNRPAASPPVQRLSPVAEKQAPGSPVIPQYGDRAPAPRRPQPLPQPSPQNEN